MTRRPYPQLGDTPLQRARAIAIAYRAHLHTTNPAVCAALDDAARDAGEHWVISQTVTVNLDDLLTTADAAELAAVGQGTIRQWRKRGYIDRHGHHRFDNFARESAIRAVARHAIATPLRLYPPEWENYPDISEHDWAAVRREAERITGQSAATAVPPHPACGAAPRGRDAPSPRTTSRHAATAAAPATPPTPAPHPE